METPERIYYVTDGPFRYLSTERRNPSDIEYTRTRPTPPDGEGENLVDMSTKSLKMEREKFQSYIDGPENDHRTTSHGSASLDYWMDTIEDIDRELERRRILSLPRPERERISRLSQHEELVKAAREVITLAMANLDFDIISEDFGEAFNRLWRAAGMDKENIKALAALEER